MHDMHYYQWNIADYRADTAHLNIIEHGIYRQLIDWYYLDERPIPKETQVVTRRLALGSDMLHLLENVLSDFFKLTDLGYVHPRIELELERYRTQFAKNRVNGMLGGRPTKTQVVSENNHMATQNNPSAPLTNNQEPITNIKDIVANDVDDCPHKEIIKLYHEHLPMMTRIKTWTEKRSRQLKARWREDKSRQNLAYWEKLFKYIAVSDFLTGKSKDWQADLEWITKSENFAKIIEGKYENKVGA
jgi:uncharacterized protein YdaU (DUF1376 family)